MTRSGIGYDAHRLVAGRKLILGGIEIPHSVGLDGHSDADVLSHAIADALLGAAGEGDIGHHFPNTDENIRGISSIAILARVREILLLKRAQIIHVDATLIAEAPKIAPHIPAMRAEIGNALQVEIARVSIKATTNEGLGTIGRGEGMSALAIATVDQE